MIIILAAEPGLGKSYQSMQFSEEIKMLDLENRNEEKRRRFFDDRLLEVIPVKEYTPEYLDDYYKSFLGLGKSINQLVKNHDNISTIIVDGISDIRNKYTKAKWHIEHPKRKNPMPTEYKDINDDTKILLTPLINLCRIKHIDLVLTAQMKDDYETTFIESEGKLVKQSSKCGRVASTQDWIDYDVDIIVELKHPVKNGIENLNKWIAYCVKSPIGSWEIDITGKCLYDELLGMGLGDL